MDSALPAKVFGHPVRVVSIGLCLAAVAGLALAGLAEKPWDVMAPSGKEFSVVHSVATAGWYGLTVSALGFMILGLTAGLWMKPQPSGTREVSAPVPRWFWPMVIAAVVVSAGMNAPRLAAGFWDDEEYSIRRSIAGTFRAAEEGSVKFKSIPWRDTFFYYQKPNNHILNSILARLANSVWRAIVRPAGLPYSEPVVRFPAFLAGLGGIAAVACLLKALGLPGAGILAAWLLALHPWHARFTPEVRGYAFLFLLVPLACHLAILAVRDGRWRWWLASGLCQFFMLYAWAGSLEFLVLLNAGVFGLVLVSTNRNSNLTRFFVSSCLAGLVSLLLYAPCAPQFLKYSKSMTFQPIDLSWVVNVAARFVTGLSWKVTYPETHHSASAMWEGVPWLGGLVGGIVVLGLGIGSVRLMFSGAERASLLPVLLLPAVIFTAMALVKGLHLFEWYVIGALPGLVIVSAVGMAWLAECMSRGNRGVSVAFGCLFCLGFWIFNASSLHALATRPICPIRESVLLTRPTLNPHEPVNRSILTAFILGSPHVYDPHAIHLDSPDTLQRLMAEASTHGKALFINQSYTESSMESHPEVCALLLDPHLFERTRLPGIEPMFDRDVFRYLKGP